MPLFGHHNAGQATTTAQGQQNVLHKGDPVHNNNVAGTEHTAHHGHTGPGPAIGAAAGGAAGHYEGHTAAGTALGAAAGHHHAKTHPSAPIAEPGITAPGAAAPGVHAGGYPAATHQGGSTASSGEKAFVGKLEHAAGTVLCSSTLKAKGIEKEREAQALKMQSAELSQAERLESEAQARRERAVGHGAHPQHLNGGHHAGGAPVGDTYGGGIPPTGTAGGVPNMNNPGTAGGLGPQGAGGLR